jgi:Family of unknown function (DUF6152)
MKTSIRKAALVLATLVTGAAAWAHHSAVQFDFAKSVTYTGVVKDFAAINPHMRLVVELKDAKGTHTVRFEGHSTNNMYRNGYRKGMVKVGDTITVTAAPLRDGTEGGYVIGAQVDKGQYFGARPRGTAPQDAQRVGEETRRAAEGR